MQSEENVEKGGKDYRSKKPDDRYQILDVRKTGITHKRFQVR